MTANLEMVKAAINNNTHVRAEIEEIWIDYGAGWKENTIVIYYINKNGREDDYQLLSPREVKEANAGLLSLESIQNHINDINKRGW